MAAQHFSGSGDPNGDVFGNPGDTYQNLTPGSETFWTKETGFGTNTGWVTLASASSVGSGDRTWYGNGIDGDLVVASGTVVTLDRNRSYQNVTVQTNACLYGAAWKLCIADNLLIEGTGTLEASGMNGGLAGVGGGGGNQNVGGTLKSGYVIPGGYGPGAIGLRGSTGGQGGQNAAPGNNGANLSVGGLRTMNGSAGGDGGASDIEVGGTGGLHQGDAECFSTPYVATARTEETDVEDWVNGGAGGGGGGGTGGATGGRGGGGGGTLRVSARIITCPDGAIKSTGGNGGDGGGDEIQAGGGGGGGMGGVILLITDGPFDPIVKCDVSGGTGGAGAGIGVDGTDGDAGQVVALSPILGPL